jgi:copper(I)-binding protein
MIASAPLLAIPVAARALTQASGPVQIGPSSGDGDVQNHSAALSTTVINYGGLPDRLINVACPGTGTASLANGHVQPVGNAQRNGLDVPGSGSGKTVPVQVQISLTNAAQPMAAGALVPCSLYFEHAGQRIVVFTLGVHETATDEP